MVNNVDKYETIVQVFLILIVKFYFSSQSQLLGSIQSKTLSGAYHLYSCRVILMNLKNNNNLIKIGQRIREKRKKLSLTLDDMAVRTKLSKGLLSKIENFRTIPSLPVLACISDNLGVDLAELVGGLGKASVEKYYFVKAGDRETITRRDGAVGFLYETVVSRQLDSCYFKSMILTVTPGGKRKEITTDADQFILILKGEINMHLGGDVISMQKGDALLFDGRTLHVPLNVSETDAQLLVVYLLES